MFRLFLLSLLFSSIFIQNTYAITNKQIMRNLGVPPRSIEEVRRKKLNINRNVNEKFNGFHIHNDFSCDTRELSNFNSHELSKASFINSDILENNPLTFSVSIEVIKAHLEITLKSYYNNGINFNIEKYPLRFHTDDELVAYPPDVAVDNGEERKIYYPDTLRSAAYVYYVIMPVFKKFITKGEYSELEKMMSAISFEKVLKHQEKRSIWYYKEYQKSIQQVYKFLDKIEARYLKKHNLSRMNIAFQKKIIDALLANAWASFLAVRSCDIITPAIDPQYDLNFYYEPPISRDNYLMGLGLFERIKKLTQKYLFHQHSVTKKNSLYPIQKYFDFFDSFYKTTEPPISDTIPYVHIEKLNIDALCSLGVSNTKECE